MTDISGPFTAFSELRRLGSLSEAVRPGHPAVVVVCCLLLVIVAAVAWLRHARRPIPPPRGKLTVRDLQARLDHEILTGIDQANRAEVRRFSETGAGVDSEAARVAAADTEVFPAVDTEVIPAVVPEPRVPSRIRPYLKPQSRSEASAR